MEGTKIKRLVPAYVATIPFHQGAAEIVAWYASHRASQAMDERRNQLLDTLIATYEALGSKGSRAA